MDHCRLNDNTYIFTYLLLFARCPSRNVVIVVVIEDVMIASTIATIIIIFVVIAITVTVESNIIVVYHRSDEQHGDDQCQPEWKQRQHYRQNDNSKRPCLLLRLLLVPVGTSANNP